MHVGSARRAALLAESNPVTLLVFDLLRLDGEDLTGRPLTERRELLEGLGLDGVHWQVPAAYDDGAMLLEATAQQGLEGIVSKRRALALPPRTAVAGLAEVPAPRRSGRTSWAAGATRPTAASRLGAVLVGEPTADGLVYRGRVGSGIAGKEGQRLLEVLEPLPADASRRSPTRYPRSTPPAPTGSGPRSSSTSRRSASRPAKRLRQPAYRGVRTDLDAGGPGGRAMAEKQADEVLVDVDGRTLRISNLGKVMYPTTGTTKGEVLNYYARVSAGAAAAPGTPRGDPDPLAARHRRHAVLREEPALGRPDLAALGGGPLDRLARRTATRSATRSSTGWRTSPTSPTWPLSSCTCTSGRSGRNGQPKNPNRHGHRPRPRAPGGPAGVLPGGAAGARQARRARAVRGAGDHRAARACTCTPRCPAGSTPTRCATRPRRSPRSSPAEHPDLVVWKMTKSLRGGKVFLDWSQNTGAKTTISPYSLRGRDRPYVAAPRTWEEIEDGAERGARPARDGRRAGPRRRGRGRLRGPARRP